MKLDELKDEAQLIEYHRKINSVEFYTSPSPQKRLGFLSNTPTYKMKTLATF